MNAWPLKVSDDTANNTAAMRAMQGLDESLALYPTISTSFFPIWKYLPWCPRLSRSFRQLEDGLRKGNLYISTLVDQTIQSMENKNTTATTDEPASILEKVVQFASSSS